uniref:Uncharacterized protein n=1 Tax=Panagrolaimus davidi TaxID=227884 RepID=A0A914QQL0_9BILA
MQNYMTCIFTFHNMNGVPIQVTISNLFSAVVGLSLGIATALARYIKGNNKWQTKQKYENRLLMQSIFTTVLVLLFELLTILHGIMGANYTANVNIKTETQSE